MAAGQQQPSAGASQPSSSATPAMLQQLQQQQQQPQQGPQQQQQQQQQSLQMQMAAVAAAARNGGMLNSAASPLQQQIFKQRMGMGLMGGIGVQGGAGMMKSSQPQHQMHQMQMMQMQMLHQQQQQQQQQQQRLAAAAAIKTGEAIPAARRKRRKIMDKQIPDRVGALLPESALYSQLLEFEGRVDAALARKKLEIQESVQNPPRYQRTLRMYVFNTYANQVNNHDPHMGYNPGEPPSWTLRIMGRILGDDGETENAAARSLPFPKFSSFFKRITVQLDPTMYPDNPTIVWDASRSSGNPASIITGTNNGSTSNNAPVEGFEIKRKGDKELTATIRLDMKYTPERYKLSAPLAELLGVEVETRARIIAAFWHYIKGKKLQNPNDPTLVNCDPPLQRILGEERIKFTSISHRLQQHLSAPQPIQIEHRIRLSGKNPAGNACYDIVVDVVTPLQKDMAMFLANMDRHRDIEAYDELICSSIRKINEHRKRRAFFLGFSHSPVEFINGLIASQSRDLKIINGQASRNAEKERRSDFYCQPWVEDAVIRYLNRRTARVAEAAASATPGASTVAAGAGNSSVTPN